MAAPPAHGQGQSPGNPQNNLQQRVEVLEAAVSSLSAQVAAHDSHLAALIQQLSAFGSRVTRLEDLNVATDIPVQCAQGQTVTNALTQARRHTGSVSITVFGTCVESVVVAMRFVSIRGGAGGATIQAPDSRQPVIRVATNAGLALQNITVTGGGIGVMADNGGTVFVGDGTTISGNLTGVRVDLNSQVRLVNATVENNSGDAVNVTNGGTVLVNGGFIRHNLGHAIRLQAAGANVTGGADITNNGGGIGVVGVYAGSVFTLGNARIANNAPGRDGIFAVGGSVVWLETNARITGNSGNGISVLDTSVVGKLRSLGGAQVQITGNGRWGISCSPSPGVAQLTSFFPIGQDPDLSGNVTGTHNCPASPGAG